MDVARSKRTDFSSSPEIDRWVLAPLASSLKGKDSSYVRVCRGRNSGSLSPWIARERCGGAPEEIDISINGDIASNVRSRHATLLQRS